MTKKDLLEAIKDMPEDAKIEFYHYSLLGGYAKVYNAELVDDGDTILLS